MNKSNIEVATAPELKEAFARTVGVDVKAIQVSFPDMQRRRLEDSHAVQPLAPHFFFHGIWL